MRSHKVGRIWAALALVAALMAAGATGCTKVPPGEVGIVVNQYGDQKGVEDFPLQTGRVWFNPFTEDVYKFQTYMQNMVWTASETEGSYTDDSITYADSSGVSLNADVALGYQVQGERVPYIFVKHRRGPEYITRIYLRNKVREAFQDVGSDFEAMAIVGDGKAEFHAAVKAWLNDELAEEGFIFDTVAMVGQPRVDRRVEEAINAALEAKQRAITEENRVAEKEAIALQRIAEAEGEAESIRLRAAAEAEANRIVAQSISPELVRYESIKRWNGVLPQFTGGGVVPFVDVSPAAEAGARRQQQARPARRPEAAPGQGEDRHSERIRAIEARLEDIPANSEVRQNLEQILNELREKG